jgi:hypothetical protein
MADSQDLTREETRAGKAPSGGQQLRSCICGKEECRKIMSEWSRVDPSRCGFISLPNYKDKDTVTAKYTNGFRNCVVRNVFPVFLRKESKTQRQHVNFTHFHPKILPYLQWHNHSATETKYWIPLKVGLEIGLLRKRSFDCEGINLEHFYAVPTYQIKESLRDLQIESARQGKPVAAPVIDGAKIVPRTDPLEREKKHISHLMKTNPDALALEYQKLRLASVTLKLEVKTLKQSLVKSEAVIQAKEKELMVANEELRKQRLLNISGFTRANLNSDEYHRTHEWVAHYIWGRSSFKEHKIFIGALFMHDNIDTSSGGLGDISDFEKISMCHMMIQRGYDITTLALVYDRRHGTISKYITAWMPKVGKAGHMLCEVPLELNHNFFTKEYCQLHNLPYMEEGYRKDEYE